MKRTRILLVGMIAAAGIVGLWAATLLVLPRVFGPPSGPGAFGDMFGATNALFSGLAFCAVVLTLLLQRSELQLQRKELELTRAELQGQKLQLEAQNDTFKRQSFADAFFQLLRFHRSIVDSLDVIPGGRLRMQSLTRREAVPEPRPLTGIDCISYYVDRLRRSFERILKEKDTDEAQALCDAFASVWSVAKRNMSHYLRNLWAILAFLDQEQDCASQNPYGSKFGSLKGVRHE